MKFLDKYRIIANGANVSDHYSSRADTSNASAALLFWEKVQFSYGVWDALEKNKTALILLKQVDEPTSLGFGANALNTGL